MAGFQHGLFIILLLYYLLRETSGRHQVFTYLIGCGLLLVLLPPVIRFQIPWDLILALFLPIIFWQTSQSWLYIERRLIWREVLLWMITAISLASVVVFIGKMPWLIGILYGVVISSMLWQAANNALISNPLGIIGPLTLVFLLVETSLALDSATQYFSRLLSGAGAGIGVALLSIAAVRKLPQEYESRISLAQVYLAYLIAFAIDASAVAAALVSVVVYAEFRHTNSDMKGEIMASAKSSSRFIFITVLTLFIFTAWQAHQPLTLAQWIEVSLVLCSGVLIAKLGQRIGLYRFKHMRSVWITGLKPGLFLLGTLILWPRGSELGSAMIWFALGLAILLPTLTAVLLTALRDLNSQWGDNDPDAY